MGRCVNYGLSDKGTLGEAFNLLVVQVMCANEKLNAKLGNLISNYHSSVKEHWE